MTEVSPDFPPTEFSKPTDDLPLSQWVGRIAAASVIAEKIGTAFSTHTLRMSPVPYRVLCGKAIYNRGDLNIYAAKMLDEAPLRIGGNKTHP